MGGQALTPAKWVSRYNEQEARMAKFTVEFSALTGRIRAGRVDAAGAAFTDHSEVSGPAVWAVAQWLEAHDGGEPYEIFGGGDYGYRLRVERIPKEGL